MSFLPLYIDPGILSGMYQIAYIALFGLISFFILRPWGFLKSVFSRWFAHGNSAKADEKQGNG